MSDLHFDITAVPVTFWFVFASILALWSPFGRTWLWMVFLFVAIIAGFVQHYIDMVGVIFVIIYGAVTFLLAQQLRQTEFFQNWKNKTGVWFQPSVVVVNILFLLIAGLLAAHKLPGFESYKVVGDLSLHDEADTVTIRFHFDKSIIGLFFLAWCVSRVDGFREWINIFIKIIPIIIGSVLPAFVIAYTLGYVKFDPVWSSYIVAFTFSNLLVTSVAEEVFFRGWMQAGLCRLFSKRKNGAYLAIAFTALVFGLAHLWGGIGLAIGAFLAGLGYGYAYYITGRIEAAVLTHFAFNGIHFTFFSYPVLLQH